MEESDLRSPIVGLVRVSRSPPSCRPSEAIAVEPNAVLGWAREGYPKGSISLADAADFATFPGFWRMAGRQWRSAAAELYTSVRKSAYLKACQKY